MSICLFLFSRRAWTWWEGSLVLTSSPEGLTPRGKLCLMWPFFLPLSASFDTYEVTMAAALHLTGRDFTTALCVYCKMTTRIVLLYLAGKTYIPFTLIQMFDESLNAIITLQILNVLTLQILDVLLCYPPFMPFTPVSSTHLWQTSRLQLCCKMIARGPSIKSSQYSYTGCLFEKCLYHFGDCVLGLSWIWFVLTSLIGLFNPLWADNILRYPSRALLALV